MSFNGYGRDRKEKDFLAKVGVCIVSVHSEHSPDGKEPSPNLRLEIVQTGGVDEGAYYPPADVCVFGLKNVVALRDLLDQAIAYSRLGIEEKPLEESINRIVSEGATI